MVSPQYILAEEMNDVGRKTGNGDDPKREDPIMNYAARSLIASF